MRRFAFVLSFALLGGCLLTGGASQFRSGERAYAQGNLQEAEKAYAEALSKDSGNAEYKAALAKVRKELAAQDVADARAKEKAADWAGASAAWGRAAARVPDEGDYAVRRDLSGAKAKNLGPDEWFTAVSQVADQHPDNEIVQRTLTGARAAAYQHNLQLGEEFLVAGDGKRAFEYFTKAKTIDPSAPGLSPDKLTQAEALALAAEGDVKLAEGDPVSAYEKYQAAHAKRPMPAIKAKLDRVKREASAILKKLDYARKLAERGRYAQSILAYERLLGTAGVPVTIAAEIDKVRAQLVAQDCENAKKDLARNSVSRAARDLYAAVDHSALDPVKTGVLKRGIDAARKGHPEQTLTAIESAGLEPGTPLEETLNQYATAAAKDILQRAERTAKRKPPQALQMVANLDPFADALPGIAALRRSLRSESFQDLLDDALASAKRGNDAEAAASLLAALNASKAPPAMRDPAQAGIDALKTKKYADAEASFVQAQAAAPRSRLAQRGIDVARLRRSAAEAQAVRTLKSGSGNQLAAVETLEAAGRLEPGNDRTAAGAAALVDRLKRADASDSDVAVGALVAWAARLSSLPAGAQDGLQSGASALKEGDLAGAESGFGAAKAAAPGEALPQLALQVAQRRAVKALKSDVAAVLQGDADAALALAELLESKPDDATGKKVLGQLIAKAEGLAAKKDDAEAARYLRLATVATSPAPGLKAALDRGHSALEAGNMVAAEQAYDEARDLEPGQPVAVAGYGIARGARQDALSKALASALKGGSTGPVEQALKTAIAADPASKDAQEAFSALVGKAQAEADAGNVARAAQLLAAANVVSKPETIRSELGAATAALEKKDFPTAAKGYEAVLAKGDSQVAKAGLAIAKGQRRSGLSAALRGLERGTDLEGGAAAAKTMREIDPADAQVKAAVAAALDRADKAGARGDDKKAAAELRAVMVALDEPALEPAVAALERGEYPKAQEAFEASSSDLGRRGAAIARQRNLGNLAGRLDAGGLAAAQSIAKLLAADPSNKDAQRAFAAMLDKARADAAAGRDKEAAETIRFASVAAAAPEALSAAIDVGAGHLAEGRYAEAEQGFDKALEQAKDSAVAQTGHEIAEKSRVKSEQAALRGLASGDPRPHAQVLEKSLLVEPKSKVVAQAFDKLLAQAQTKAKAGDDAETAQALEAALTLEQSDSEQQAAAAEAIALYAKASFPEARTKFVSVNAGREAADAQSRVANTGAELSLSRQIALLKDDLAQADKAGDVLRQSTLVAQILALDPNDRDASRRSGRLEGEVVDARVEAAKVAKGQGKLGVAFLYLKRAQQLAPKAEAVAGELADVTEKLKKRLDLVLIVEPVTRKKVSNSLCKGFEPMFQEQMQTIASKRTDLGGYVLSPAWTEAVRSGDERAPEVSGSLLITMTQCSLGSSQGSATFDWQILTPRSGSKVVGGTVKATLPAGVIPLEEQDGAGNNARKAFSERAAQTVTEKISTERDLTDQWLLTLAEHGREKKDPALAADAWARIEISSNLYDTERVIALEKYLDEQFR